MADEKMEHGTPPVNHARAIEERVSEAIGLAAGKADRVFESAAVLMRDIIRSTIDEAAEAGANLADVAQGILAGIVRGGRECGLATQEAFEDAARTILQHTENIGADVTAAARGILQGALRNAKRIGRRAS